MLRLHQAFAEFRHQNAGLGRPWMLSLIADGCRRLGRFDEGFEAIDHGLAAAALHGEANWEAELHRGKGELLFARAAPGDKEKAAACVHEALSVARRQGARALELRAVTSLARMLGGAEAKEARATLAVVLAGFGEGHATRDVEEAARLLTPSDASAAAAVAPI
jgi:hypothetical protein